MRIWIIPCIKSCLAFVLLLSLPALGDINFPELTGVVVDNAKILSDSTTRLITQKITKHREASSNQIVVVTLPNLQGYSIEEFGYQLGRKWGIGQEDKNNGVLLIVAVQERKIRIEVGYGLEGTLTDALCANIIQTKISPPFKLGLFNQGVNDGVTSILGVINGNYKQSKTSTEFQFTFKFFEQVIMFFFMAFLIITFIYDWLKSLIYRWQRKNQTGAASDNNGYYPDSSYDNSLSSSDNSFDGGGGDFGGGGASGDW